VNTVDRGPVAGIAVGLVFVSTAERNPAVGRVTDLAFANTEERSMFVRSVKGLASVNTKESSPVAKNAAVPGYASTVKRSNTAGCAVAQAYVSTIKGSPVAGYVVALDFVSTVNTFQDVKSVGGPATVYTAERSRGARIVVDAVFARTAKGRLVVKSVAISIFVDMVWERIFVFIVEVLEVLQELLAARRKEACQPQQRRQVEIYQKKAIQEKREWTRISDQSTLNQEKDLWKSCIYKHHFHKSSYEDIQMTIEPKHHSNSVIVIIVALVTITINI